MPRPGWSGKRDQALIRMYEMGIGLTEMADELGVSVQEVNQRLRELDRRPRPLREEPPGAPTGRRGPEID